MGFGWGRVRTLAPKGGIEMRVSLTAVALAVLALSPALAGGPLNLENPPTGTPPQEFTHQYRGCLGGLRSALARGDLAEATGVDRFSRDFNPGKHQGTVGEEEFLASFGPTSTIPLSDLCASFERSH